MADGRASIAGYNPNAVISEKIIQEQNIKSNWEYRQYMTHQADKIRAYNYKDCMNDMGYTMRAVDILDVGAPQNPPPYLFKNMFDNTRVARAEAVFPDSDLKNFYLSREQLNARKIAPVVRQEQLLERGFS
jgi:hypothetical protein